MKSIVCNDVKSRQSVTSIIERAILNQLKLTRNVSTFAFVDKSLVLTLAQKHYHSHSFAVRFAPLLQTVYPKQLLHIVEAESYFLHHHVLPVVYHILGVALRQMLADVQVAILHKHHPARLRSVVGHNFFGRDHVYLVNSGHGNDLLMTLEIRGSVKCFCTSRTALHAAHRSFAPSGRQTAHAFSSKKPGLKSDHRSPNSLHHPSQESQYWSPSTRAPSLSLHHFPAGIFLKTPMVSPR